MLSRLVQLAEFLDLARRGSKRHQAGHIAIVKICGVVGDFIAQVDQLRLKRRPKGGQIFVESGIRPKSLECFAMPSRTSNVRFSPGNRGIRILEKLDDAERLQIVIETIAETAHQAVELGFARVAEGRMADVMRQREGFGQIFVKTQHSGHGARDLRHLDGMGQAVAEMIGQAGRENLRFIFQPSKRP